MLAGPAAGGETPVPGSAERASIRDVIAHQIEAFQHDDAAGAFAFASPSIQQQMGSPERFLNLVQNLYQPVYRPRATSFGALGVEDGQVVQRVELIGPDGRPALALYSMERQPDGTWRISGCRLTVSEAASA